MVYYRDKTQVYDAFPQYKTFDWRRNYLHGLTVSHFLHVQMQ